MAYSDTTSMKNPFDSLADELVLTIIKLSATKAEGWGWGGRYRTTGWVKGIVKFDHDFLANVISKISVRFENLAKDKTLWSETVMIHPFPYTELEMKKAEYVTWKCLHEGTKEFIIRHILLLMVTLVSMYLGCSEFVITDISYLVTSDYVISDYVISKSVISKSPALYYRVSHS